MGPEVMAAAAIGGTAASSIFGAMASLWGGEAKAKQLQYQAGVAQLNRQIAKQNADWTRMAGEVSAQQKGMEGRARIGQTKAVQAGRGLDVASGSAAAVRESQQELAAYDQAMIRSNAAHRAYGFEVEAVQQEAQASLLKTGAEATKTAGMIGAVGSILGGASSVADKWFQYSTTFASTKSPTNVGYATSFEF